jgi:Ni/Fe-hydrogenase 1 B-type cytochrome subunit
LLFYHISYCLFSWGIIVFVHIYIAVYNAVFGKNGGMDAIFSGAKWEKEDKK